MLGIYTYRSPRDLLVAGGQVHIQSTFVCNANDTACIQVTSSPDRMDNSSRKSMEEDVKDMAKVESTDVGTVSDVQYGNPVPYARGQMGLTI